MTLDLPLVGVSPLLEWLPGETLFSLYSRHHRFWGCPTSEQSAQVLFGGGRRVGTHHDLPSALDAFVLRTGGRLGTPNHLARDRTLLRYYRPFVSATEVDAAVGVMRGPTVAHLKFRLGLLTSRFRANHPLKACASCMREDEVCSGWVYGTCGISTLASGCVRGIEARCCCRRSSQPASADSYGPCRPNMPRASAGPRIRRRQRRKLSSQLSHECVQSSRLLTSFGFLGLSTVWVDVNGVDEGPVVDPP